MTRTKLSQTIEKEELIDLSQTKAVEMTLNTENMALIMDRLTELYKDPIAASVRETVSNAIDAAVEEDNNPLVEIFTPSAMSPKFIVRDNGTGMSLNTIEKLYSQYGFSTKGNNMSVIGAYGLGAKSPLAYSSEFTIKSVRNNMQTTAIMTRKPEGYFIEIVEHKQVDALNGTTVTIPVIKGDIEHFEDIVDMYRNTPLDGVAIKVNGEAVSNKALLITDALKIHVSDTETVYGKVYLDEADGNIVNVIMSLGSGTNDFNHDTIKYAIGGWKYSLDTDKIYTRRSSNITIQIEPGVVDFDSSRDNIVNNKRLQKMQSLIAEQHEFLIKAIVDSMNLRKVEEWVPTFASLTNGYAYYSEYALVSKEGAVTVSEVNRNRNELKPIHMLQDFTSVEGVRLGDLFTDVDLKVHTVFLAEAVHGSSQTRLERMCGHPSRDDSYGLPIRYTNATISGINHQLKEDLNSGTYIKHGTYCAVSNASSFGELVVITGINKDTLKQFTSNRKKIIDKELASLNNNRRHVPFMLSSLDKATMSTYLALHEEYLNVKVVDIQEYVDMFKVSRSTGERRAPSPVKPSETRRINGFEFTWDTTKSRFWDVNEIKNETFEDIKANYDYIIATGKEIDTIGTLDIVHIANEAAKRLDKSIEDVKLYVIPYGLGDGLGRIRIMDTEYMGDKLITYYHKFKSDTLNYLEDTKITNDNFVFEDLPMSAQKFVMFRYIASNQFGGDASVDLLAHAAHNLKLDGPLGELFEYMVALKKTPSYDYFANIRREDRTVIFSSEEFFKEIDILEDINTLKGIASDIRGLNTVSTYRMMSSQYTPNEELDDLMRTAVIKVIEGYLIEKLRG